MTKGYLIISMSIHFANKTPLLIRDLNFKELSKDF
jgi:hypothetical protein